MSKTKQPSKGNKPKGSSVPIFSFFRSNKATKPDKTLTLEQYLFSIKSGQWKDLVNRVRAKRDSPHYKRLKDKLPAVTVSGNFQFRGKGVHVTKKLHEHSGLICLDVDKKDNPKIRTKDLIDSDCVAQFVSAGGEGVKIIYYCTKVEEEATHRRIYDAAIDRLQKLGVKIKVDPVVKSVSSLQYVSYDPEAYINYGSDLTLKPLPPIKRVEPKKPAVAVQELIRQLHEYADALGNRDCTKEYEDWLSIMFGISYSIGEAGREIVHKLSKNYKGYDPAECNDKFDGCLDIRDLKQVEKPVTVATVFQIINSHLPKVEARRLGKKYNKAHAVGIGEEDSNDNTDLSGFVRYKLFLFKKLIDKETSMIKELVPFRINLNEFEALLRSKGFYRYERFFVHVVDNVVEIVDAPDILRIVTDHIQQEGDYCFIYKKMEYVFSWEEIIHKWREIRALSTTVNQLAASVPHWQPNLLRDTSEESYIPYQNGVLRVTKTEMKLLPYAKIDYQIWKERILPRNYQESKKPGMFEEFFANVMGRGKTLKERTQSPSYKRALWYFGYMLHGNKRESTARAWMLYDIRSGNNGRSGKTIVGSAVGKIRNVTVIDGKQVDLSNRFAFQTVKPWTDVIFIDDPSRYMSLNPLFNMITGLTSADRKGKDPIEKGFKIMFASNWILENEGASESGRQFVSQLDDFYNRYSKEHNNTITPLVDLHGKEFFTDWDVKDWAQFDTFCSRALQFHLASKAPENTIIGSAAILRFIQLHEEELFFELSLALATNIKTVSGNSSSISQQLLTGIIRENNESLKANKAGKIAREYLHAIGCKDLHISTIRQQGGRIGMAYHFTGNLRTLDFGHIKDRLNFK